MTENHEKDPMTRRLPVGETRGIPVEFWVFHDRFHRAYRHYAELLLGDKHIAGQVVHLVFLSLLKGWKRLMEEANPHQSAWAHLKEAVDDVLVLQGQGPALTRTAAFSRVSRKVIEDARDEFAAMESSLGLYPAIAKLPPRQLDVVVLQHVLGYDTTRTADTMGVTEATVRSHLTNARRRIAHELGIDLDDDRNES